MRYGALNPLADGVQFAVAEDEKILFRAFVPMKGREAAALPGFVENTLKEHGLALADISRWSVGAGPGGFTALRMTAALAAAWVMGFADRAYRCVPSAVAIIGNQPGKSGELADCLFDGRNHEILLYGMRFEEGEWRPSGESAVLNAEAFAKRRAENPSRRIFCSSAEAEAVKAIAGEIGVISVEPDAASLIAAKFMPYDSDPDKIVYIREAVETH